MALTKFSRKNKPNILGAKQTAWQTSRLSGMIKRRGKPVTKHRLSEHSGQTQVQLAVFTQKLENIADS